MYAIMQSGGKQHTVKVGDFVELEKLEGEVGAEVVFDTVLAVGEEGGKLNVGTPVIAGASVKAEIVDYRQELVCFGYESLDTHVCLAFGCNLQNCFKG